MTTSSEPFLYCRLPGEKSFRRYGFTCADSEKLTFGDAVVRPWPGTPVSDMSVCPESTPEEEYIGAVSELAGSLRASRGKTVVCRQICGRRSAEEIIAGAERYFDRFPDMFCFIFWHPATKWWLGASPELLLESLSACEAMTRSLAGTQPAGAGPWSAKNREEHRFVVDDIMARLSGVVPPVEAVALAPASLRYGSIEHLCTPVRVCSSAPLPFSEIIEAIHPTPAVCGFPRTDAMRRIDRAESWPRNCYGGYITVPTPRGPVAYVILRCVHFDGERWAVYTGSGITGDSDAADEWAETRAKARPLLDLVEAPVLSPHDF